MAEKGTTDGRVQRSERSRQAIINATLSLIRAGHLMPTAQQVADESGVTIRTVFRHFEDMEALYVETDATLRPEYEGNFLQADHRGTFEERVVRAIECHEKVYSEWADVIRFTRAHKWRSPTLTQQYARNQRGLRKDLERWLPELRQVPDELREAIDGIASFEYWDRLRTEQGLGKKAATELVSNLLLGLLRA